MSLLTAMPELSADWCPLTDRRPLTYLIRHAAVLAAYVMPTATWDHDVMFRPPTAGAPGEFFIEGFPEPGNVELETRSDTPLAVAMLRHNVAEYANRLRERDDQRYFVEPTSRWATNLLTMAGVEHRAILLVRDPRSELAEVWRGVRRNGCLPSPVTHVDTPLAFAEREANWKYRELLADLARPRSDGNQLVLRYETLLADPNGTWARLRAWLSLPTLPPPVLRPTLHEWPEARWREILPAAVDDVCRQRMGNEMRAHGYAL